MDWLIIVLVLVLGGLAFQHSPDRLPAVALAKAGEGGWIVGLMDYPINGVVEHGALRKWRCHRRVAPRAAGAKSGFMVLMHDSRIIELFSVAYVLTEPNGLSPAFDVQRSMFDVWDHPWRSASGQ